MDNGVFVKIDEYKGVLEVVGLIKERIADAKDKIGKIRALKEREDSELNTWSTKLNEIIAKVEDIDGMLLKPSI